MSFYIILPSNTSTSNTASSFVVDWDTSLTLIGKWKVALVEYAICIPSVHEWQHMYVYSSVSEPILVGNVRVPLLRQIWIDESNDKLILHEVLDHPMYLPVSSSSINNIEIQIRNDKGELINFPKDSKTSLTLHFEQ